MEEDCEKIFVQKGGKPWLLLFRGFMGFMALLSFFHLMAHIPLGEAVTYNATFPLFNPIKKEKQ